jgi:N-carbamoyl-L-amino-acid hydrolase
MGNIFARRPGRRDDLPPMVAGSHLDTQPLGGKFDGVYGVLAGLEVIRTLNDHDIATEAPLEVAVWTNEEGSRFAPAMVASGVFAGLFERDYALTRQDADGKTLGEELARIGYLGPESCGTRPLGAFFEAHIEQGPILEREGEAIGVVGRPGPALVRRDRRGPGRPCRLDPPARPPRRPGRRIRHDHRRAPGR